MLSWPRAYAGGGVAQQCRTRAWCVIHFAPFWRIELRVTLAAQAELEARRAEAAALVGPECMLSDDVRERIEATLEKVTKAVVVDVA